MNTPSKPSWLLPLIMTAVAGLLTLVLIHIGDIKAANARAEMEDHFDDMTQINVSLVQTALEAFHDEHGAYPACNQFQIVTLHSDDSVSRRTAYDLNQYFRGGIAPIDPYSNEPLIVKFVDTDDSLRCLLPGDVVVKILAYSRDRQTATFVHTYGVAHDLRPLPAMLSASSVPGGATTMTWAEFKQAWRQGGRKIVLVDSLPGYFTVDDTLFRFNEPK